MCIEYQFLCSFQDWRTVSQLTHVVFNIYKQISINITLVFLASAIIAYFQQLSVHTFFLFIRDQYVILCFHLISMHACVFCVSDIKIHDSHSVGQGLICQLLFFLLIFLLTRQRFHVGFFMPTFISPCFTVGHTFENSWGHHYFSKKIKEKENRQKLSKETFQDHVQAMRKQTTTAAGAARTKGLKKLIVRSVQVYF